MPMGSHCIAKDAIPVPAVLRRKVDSEAERGQLDARTKGLLRPYIKVVDAIMHSRDALANLMILLALSLEWPRGPHPCWTRLQSVRKTCDEIRASGADAQGRLVAPPAPLAGGAGVLRV